MSCMAGRKRLLMVSAVTCLVLLLAVNGIAAGEKPQSAFEEGTESGFTTTFGVEEDNIRRATYYDRTNYEWPLTAGPIYGEVSVALKRTPGTLHTRVGSFRFDQDFGIPAALRTTNHLSATGVQYFVIQLDPAYFGTQKAVDALMGAIQTGGGAEMTPMAITSHLVRLTPAAMAAVQGSAGVINIEPYHPAFKLSPLIGNQPLSDPFRAVSDIYTLDLMLHKGENAAAVASVLSRMGGNVLVATNALVRVEIHRSMLNDVASIEAVFMVDEWKKQFTRAEETTNVIQTGNYFAGGIEAPSPYHNAGIRGNGQIIMILDSGISIDAGDMSDTDSIPGTPGLTHRKVLVNEATNQFGGFGDTLSCDDPLLGGFTHGQVVSATALGWATDVEPAYGTGFFAEDRQGNQYALDGVAPMAKVVFYDGNVTPATGNCGDAENNGIIDGDLYAAPAGGSLGVSHVIHGARVVNFSWGDLSNVYGIRATDIDTFLNDKEDSMVFVSAGNAGADDDSNGIPDPGTLGNPASCKNCLAIGASGNANSNGDRRTERDKAFFSSAGPAPGGRIAPQLMAPGQERGDMGVDSEFACRSNDNDQSGLVECDVNTDFAGTSFASPAAAGAALLVRDYFAMGFYPDGTDTNPSNAGDQRANVSGALVKAALIASADMLVNPLGDDTFNALGANLSARYRFNNEQGYGRIQLDNVLPLQAWSLSPVGMIVKDGGITGDAFGDLSGLSGVMPIAGGTQSETFEMCDDSQELRVSLVWLEASGEVMLNDLDLEVEGPDGAIYYGNYFTDDNNRSGSLDTGEDCPPINGGGDNGLVDAYPWSIPTCVNSVHDTDNPMEAIFLSPDPDADGITEDDYNQVAGHAGLWTIRVIGNTMSSDTNYAVVVSGGVCLGSSVRFDAGNYVCNDSATITVNDIDAIDDPMAGLTEAEISNRVTVDVLDTDGLTVLDSETGLVFTQQTGLRFVSDEMQMSDGTQFDPGNGILDIRHDLTIRVTYQDESTEGGVDPGDIRRVATSKINCATSIKFGTLEFGKFGANGIFDLDGGCETNLRGMYDFGFPDEYMDAGESLGYGLAFTSTESETLIDVIASLRCVLTDVDSPEECLPGTSDCADPNRENNPPCTGITITDSPKVVGDIPQGSSMAAYFNVTVDGTVTPLTEVEMILGLSSPASGKSNAGLAISRHTLDVDESSLYYSTDFPTGGSQIKDYNNNEIEDVVTTDFNDFHLDYRVESWTWSDASSTNPDLLFFAPFDFDSNNGGFQVGVTATTDLNLVVAKPTLWGEDLNFDGLSQGDFEALRDPAGTPALDYGYSTEGGCGWQTQNGLATVDGGVWHTGLIGNNEGAVNPASCLADGDSGPNRCQATENSIGTTTGQLMWFEVLLTPEINRVDPAKRVEMVDFAWNMTQDIATIVESFTWELDNDIDKLEPVDLKADSFISGIMRGDFGPVSDAGNPQLGAPHHMGMNGGFAMFAQYSGTSDMFFNGTIGNNRVGEQSCFFTAGPTLVTALGTAYPPDDDIDNDADGLTDEYVTANGPLRNYDISTFNGPDLRYTTWEDLFGDTGNSFQGGLGYVVLEGTSVNDSQGKSYGVTIDDVVIEWREIELVPDASDCAGSGECASLDLQTYNFFEGAALIQVTSIERTPPDINNCNFNFYCTNTDGSPTTTPCGLPGSPDNEDCVGIDPDAFCSTPNLDDEVVPYQDCDGDGILDLVVEAYNANRQDSEIFYLNNTGNSVNPHEYKGEIPITPTFDVDGVLVGGHHFENGALFVEQIGTSFPIVQVEYLDDGCLDDPMPSKQGIRYEWTTVFMEVANMALAGFSLGDDNDNDGYADAGETVQMTITLKNNTNKVFTNVVARLTTNSPNIECVTASSAAIGTMEPMQIVTATAPFAFKVVNTINRAGIFDELSAEFAVTVSGEGFSTLNAPISVVMDLDLDVTDIGSGPTTFSESFDAGTFGQFTTMNIDQPISGDNALSDGYRCQYSDPDNINANAYGREMCYLGQNNTDPFVGDLIYEFHVHTLTSPDGGRAMSSPNSMHLGTHDDPNNAGMDTTSLGQLDAVVTTLPINLSAEATSTLTFKHQISMIDDRTVNVPGNETPDRVAVSVKKVDVAGVEQGWWIKIAPYKNVHHVQGTDLFYECLFDPIDDGSTEDTFFDPSDPFRRYGPSTTCFPEFTYSDMGNTRFDADFDPLAIHDASEIGESFEGAVGPGTWVESRYDLARYRGLRLKLRYLYTSIAVDSPATNYNELFNLPDGWEGDDGWYIDDIQVSNTLVTPASLAPDESPGFVPNDLACVTPCAGLAADLSSNLAAGGHIIGIPGGVINLTAETSSAVQCLGTLQYQFWSDDDVNGILDGSDTMIRSWTDNPVLTQVPPGDTTYAVVIRCTATTVPCTGVNTAFLPVTVLCPSSGNLGGFNETVYVDALKTSLTWTTVTNVDAIYGSLDALLATGYTGSVLDCMAYQVDTNTVSIALEPASGSGFYYLVKGNGGGTYCNEGSSSWGSVLRDTDLATACP